jgi:hypothetical protein
MGAGSARRRDGGSRRDGGGRAPRAHALDADLCRRPLTPDSRQQVPLRPECRLAEPLLAAATFPDQHVRLDRPTLVVALLAQERLVPAQQTAKREGAKREWWKECHSGRSNGSKTPAIKRGARRVHVERPCSDPLSRWLPSGKGETRTSATIVSLRADISSLPDRPPARRDRSTRPRSRGEPGMTALLGHPSIDQSVGGPGHEAISLRDETGQYRELRKRIPGAGAHLGIHDECRRMAVQVPFEI